jgi:predicted O-methyltransferase YrrM
MDIIKSLKAKALNWSLPKPYQCRHIEYSTVASAEDDFGWPNERLIELSLAAANHARSINLSSICKRMPAPPFYPDIWPGEHYKLLAGLVLELQPRRIVEIGTFTGLGSLSLLSKMPADCELVTVDIIPWGKIPGAVLRQSDFEAHRFRQIIGDLGNPVFFASFADVLCDCNLLFVDGPKDVVFENAFLKNLETISPQKDALLLFDDIRLWNMLKIWRQIARPKLDLTSFGHWSGTGIVDWNASPTPFGPSRASP